MEKFYTLRSRNYLTTFSARAELRKNAIDNGLCGFHSGRELFEQLAFGDHYPEYILFPIVFHQDEGKRLRDVLDMRSVGFFVISDRMKLVLEENSLTGWKTYPIQIYDKKKNLISGYSGFTVTGKGGRVYYSLNEAWDPVLGWNPAGWDGSDFFYLENTRHILITEKVMKVLRKHKIDAIDMDPLEDSVKLDSLAGKKEGGYASFSIIHNRPQRYQGFQWDSFLDWDMLRLIESDLKDERLESIEKCLELAFRYGVAGRSTSVLSLIHLENAEQTENRVFRYVALRESVFCCGKAIECIDNAARLLGTISDSAPFILDEFALNHRLITSPDLWEQYMEWYTPTIRRMHIDIYNALAAYLEKQQYRGTTDKIQQYLENALMQLAQSISILSEACAAGINECQFVCPNE